MVESKSTALPLGYAPTASGPQTADAKRAHHNQAPVRGQSSRRCHMPIHAQKSERAVQACPSGQIPQFPWSAGSRAKPIGRTDRIARQRRHTYGIRRVASSRLERYKDASLASVGLELEPSRALFSGNTAAVTFAVAAWVMKRIRHVAHAVRHLTVGRSVAQPGSALASGARGREFESPRSDQ